MARSRRRGGVRAALCALAAAALLPGRAGAGGAAVLEAAAGGGASGSLPPPQSSAATTAAAAAAAAGVLCEYACAGGACLRLLGCAPRGHAGAAPDEGGCTVRPPPHTSPLIVVSARARPRLRSGARAPAAAARRAPAPPRAAPLTRPRAASRAAPRQPPAQPGASRCVAAAPSCAACPSQQPGARGAGARRHLAADVGPPPLSALAAAAVAAGDASAASPGCGSESVPDGTALVTYTNAHHFELLLLQARGASKTHPCLRARARAQKQADARAAPSFWGFRFPLSRVACVAAPLRSAAWRRSRGWRACWSALSRCASTTAAWRSARSTASSENTPHTRTHTRIMREFPCARLCAC
jgi:hypothetical protein